MTWRDRSLACLRYLDGSGRLPCWRVWANRLAWAAVCVCVALLLLTCWNIYRINHRQRIAFEFVGMGKALLAYAKENGGQFPRSLSQVVREDVYHMLRKDELIYFTPGQALVSRPEFVMLWPRHRLALDRDGRATYLPAKSPVWDEVRALSKPAPQH